MLLLPSCMFSEEVDTVFHNGKINYHNGLEWKSGQAMAIKDGKIIEEGMGEEIYTNPKNNYTKRLIDSIPKGIVA